MAHRERGTEWSARDRRPFVLARSSFFSIERRNFQVGITGPSSINTPTDGHSLGCSKVHQSRQLMAPNPVMPFQRDSTPLGLGRKLSSMLDVLQLLEFTFPKDNCSQTKWCSTSVCLVMTLNPKLRAIFLHV